MPNERHTYLIGEVGQNHNGSVDLAKLIIDMLARPVRELQGDERNIAVLARAYHGVSPDSVGNGKGGFVEPRK